MILFHIASQQYECACTDENTEYKQQRCLVLRFFPKGILPYHVAMCWNCNLPVLALSLSVEPWRLSDRYRWSGGKVGSCPLGPFANLVSAFPGSLHSLWQDPEECVHSKKGRKWNPISNLHLPKRSVCPLRGQKKPRHFCAKTKIALILLLHLNAPTCPSVQSHLKQISITDYLHRIGLNLKPG